jgi:tetratricopeptide (TPR) repeat protein
MATRFTTPYAIAVGFHICASARAQVRWDDPLVSRPVCFMVMPFNSKPVPDHGEIDFNALWDHAFAPLLREIGYEPIRADEDLGSSILADMLIRLTASDLVVADLSLANANVYYEIGIRHAARRPGCVLIAPDWATPPFDVQQIRHLTYPSPVGGLSDDGISAIHQALREPLRRAAVAESPVYQLVPGYPGDLPQTDSLKFQEFVGYLTEFQARVGVIRAAPVAKQGPLAEQLLRDYPLSEPQSPAVILELVGSARDYLDFAAVLDLVARLPADLSRLPVVIEQEALALGKSGRNPEAVAKLKQLIGLTGPNPERLGLLGGRYKDMWREAIRDGQNADARRYLSQAISSYSDGMWLDLNEYYCSSNLPRLLRSRDDPGDGDLAREAADVTRHACQRAQCVGKHDEWLESTLLGAAFDAGDADQAEFLLSQIIEQGPSRWKLDSTLSDLRAALSEQASTLAVDRRDRLATVLSGLERLAEPTVR